MMRINPINVNYNHLNFCSKKDINSNLELHYNNVGGVSVFDFQPIRNNDEVVIEINKLDTEAKEVEQEARNVDKEVQSKSREIYNDMEMKRDYVISRYNEEVKKDGKDGEQDKPANIEVAEDKLLEYIDGKLNRISIFDKGELVSITEYQNNKPDIVDVYQYEDNKPVSAQKGCSYTSGNTLPSVDDIYEFKNGKINSYTMGKKYIDNKICLVALAINYQDGQMKKYFDGIIMPEKNARSELGVLEFNDDNSLSAYIQQRNIENSGKTSYRMRLDYENSKPIMYTKNYTNSSIKTPERYNLIDGTWKRK